VQPHLEPLQHPAVLDPLAPHRSPRVVRHRVEASAAVAVDHLTPPGLAPSLPSLRPGVRWAAAWAKTVGAVAAILLGDRLQPPRHGLGHDGVLQGRQPPWAPLAVALGEPSAHHRWRTGRAMDALFVSCRQARCQVGLGGRPWAPVHPRGTWRGATPTRPFPPRPLQGMGERGARQVGLRRCLRGAPCPAPRDGRRARSLWPRACLGAARTPGFTCAAPGPMDGVGSLACRPLCCPRARLPRLAVPGGVLVRVCGGTR
jgi:hypothetical protein